jgi:hypothetical protein
MSAPSSYQASPHDGRTEVESVDVLEVLTEWAEGHKPTEHAEGTFAARYPGTCASCTHRITPGDPVQYGIDDQLEHHSCPDELTIGAQGVCGGCYLEMPLSGTCGVC